MAIALKDVNVSPLKEPRGIMRIIQAIFALFAILTTTAFSTYPKLRIVCPRFHYAVLLRLYYPFRNNPIDAPLECTYVEDVRFVTTYMSQSFAAGAEFFVAIGFLSLIFCGAMIFVYLARDQEYQEKTWIPIVEFCVTIALSLFWFIASCTWAAGVSNMKYYSDPNFWQTDLLVCLEPRAKCGSEELGSFGTLNVSIISGFANVLLWGVGAWFVFKETMFFEKLSKIRSDSKSETTETPPQQPSAETQTAA